MSSTTAPARRDKDRVSLEQLLGMLEKPRRSGDQHAALCPAHEDSNPSLTIGLGDDGRILVDCKAGCSFEDICAALHVEPWQLMPPQVPTIVGVRNGASRPAKRAPSALTAAQVEAMHRDLLQDMPTMRHVTEVLRFPRELVDALQLGLWRAPDGRRLAYPYQRDGRWSFANCRALDDQPEKFKRTPAGQPTTLYGGDELEDGGVAILFEGERDAVAARAMGLGAEVGGAAGAAIVAMPGSDQTKVAIAALRSQQLVYVATDRDDAGDEAAQKIIAGLGSDRGRRVRLEGFKDLGDLLESHGVDRAREIALRAFQTADDPLAVYAIDRVLDAEEARLEAGVRHAPTGWPRLDAAIGGGLMIPSLNVIGAGPKSLKSVFAQRIAERHVEAGGFAYVLDLENGALRWLRRALCCRAELAPSAVRRAMHDAGAGVFTSRDAATRWTAAKAWLRELRSGLRLVTKAPQDLAADLRAARRAAGARPLLAVFDSLQKLPGNLEERRATIDGWMRLLEQLRHELDAVFLLVSETTTDTRGRFEAHEAAFKESRSISYGCDLAMTLTRPRADDEDEDPVSTLRIELARDCEEDPRGDVASYRAVWPFYGVEEIDPVPRSKKKRQEPKADAAEAFLRDVLADGKVHVQEILARGRGAGFSESTLQRAKRTIGAQSCSLELRSAWRLPE